MYEVSRNGRFLLGSLSLALASFHATPESLAKEPAALTQDSDEILKEKAEKFLLTFSKLQSVLADSTQTFSSDELERILTGHEDFFSYYDKALRDLESQHNNFKAEFAHRYRNENMPSFLSPTLTYKPVNYTPSTPPLEVSKDWEFSKFILEIYERSHRLAMHIRLLRDNLEHNNQPCDKEWAELMPDLAALKKKGSLPSNFIIDSASTKRDIDSLNEVITYICVTSALEIDLMTRKESALEILIEREERYDLQNRHPIFRNFCDASVYIAPIEAKVFVIEPPKEAKEVSEDAVLDSLFEDPPWMAESTQPVSDSIIDTISNCAGESLRESRLQVAYCLKDSADRIAALKMLYEEEKAAFLEASDKNSNDTAQIRAVLEELGRRRFVEIAASMQDLKVYMWQGYHIIDRYDYVTSSAIHYLCEDVMLTTFIHEYALDDVCAKTLLRMRDRSWEGNYGGGYEYAKSLREKYGGDSLQALLELRAIPTSSVAARAYEEQAHARSEHTLVQHGFTAEDMEAERMRTVYRQADDERAWEQAMMSNQSNAIVALRETIMLEQGELSELFSRYVKLFEP